MTTNYLKEKGFKFYDYTLEKIKDMSLKNIDVDYNECGGYIDGYTQYNEQVIVCMHENSDTMYDYACKIIDFLTKPKEQ